MKIGEHYYTPRFCTVKIKEMFESRSEAAAAGYKEPTYWDDEEYGIAGKSLDMYHMEFAGYKITGKANKYAS